MTIHFFTFSDRKAPSSRPRAFQVAEELERRGYAVRMHVPTVLSLSLTHWPRKSVLIMQTVGALFSIRAGDIVYLQRTVANKYFFALMVVYLKLSRQKMIFDFDDPVYVHSFFKTKTFTKMADAVVTCTHAQVEWARQFNKNVHVIHIGLDFEKYKKFSKDYSAAGTPCVIGWVGTAPEHYFNLKLLVPVFEALRTQTSIPLKFVLIGSLGSQKIYDLFRTIDGLDVEFIDSLDWTDGEVVPREIQKFDIGVVPHRSEGVWNEGKTSFKVLEYMACGVPAVVSRFGEMPHIIRDGENGFIASNAHEWAEKLERLARDRSLREKFGREGQQTVREHYSFDALMPRYIEVLRSIEKN